MNENDAALVMSIETSVAIQRLNNLEDAFNKLKGIGKIPADIAAQFDPLIDKVIKLRENLVQADAGFNTDNLKEYIKEVPKLEKSLSGAISAFGKAGDANKQLDKTLQESGKKSYDDYVQQTTSRIRLGEGLTAADNRILNNIIKKIETGTQLEASENRLIAIQKQSIAQDREQIAVQAQLNQALRDSAAKLNAPQRIQRANVESAGTAFVAARSTALATGSTADEAAALASLRNVYAERRRLAELTISNQSELNAKLNSLQTSQATAELKLVQGAARSRSNIDNRSAEEKIASIRRMIRADQELGPSEQQILRVTAQRIQQLEKSTPEETRLIKAIQLKISKNKELSESERLVATAYKETSAQVNNHESVTLRMMKATEGLRLEVSRIRNMLLLYTFAWNMVVPAIAKAIKAYADYERSTQGLMAVSGKLNIGVSDTTIALDRLTKDGLLKVSDASVALRQLLSTGIGLPEAVRLMEGFKDAAAFGRNSSIDFAQAVRGQAEGFKTLSSQLMDAGGITKNINDIIREEAKLIGKTTDQLSEHEKHLLLAKGLTKEFALSKGDAAQAADTLGGKLDQLDAKTTKLQEGFGKLIYEHGGGKELISMFIKIISVVDRATEALGRFLDKRGGGGGMGRPLEDLLGPDFAGSLLQEMASGEAKNLSEALTRTPLKQKQIEKNKTTLRSLEDQGRAIAIGKEPDQYDRQIDQVREQFRKKLRSINEIITKGGVTPEVKETVLALQKYYTQAIDGINAKKVADVMKDKWTRIVNLSKAQLGQQEAVFTIDIEGLTHRAKKVETMPQYEQVKFDARNKLTKDRDEALKILDELANNEKEKANKTITLKEELSLELQRIDSDKTKKIMQINDQLEDALIAINERGYAAYAASRDRATAKAEQEANKQKEIEKFILFMKTHTSEEVENVEEKNRALRLKAEQTLFQNSAIIASMSLEERKKIFEDFAKWLDDQVTKKEESVNKKQLDAMNKIVGEFGRMNQAALVFDKNASRAFTKATQGALYTAQAIRGIGDAYLEIEKGIAAGGLLGGLGVAGGILGLVETGLNIAAEIKQGGDSERSKRNQQARAFGATVQRGPQYVTINASFGVESGHDTIFGEDGITILKDNLVQQIQQAYANGELNFS